MRRIAVIGLIAVGLFTILTVVDHIRAEEVFTWGGFAADMFETAVLVGAVAMTSFTMVETREMRRERRDLLADLDRSRAEGRRWRRAARSHVEGLSRAIAAQFEDWNLTGSERDVAVLMLKGLSHREIAAIRQNSERTVRQHAASVYAKSGLSSRAQLTGFFLEDLLAPQPAGGTDLTLVRDGEV